MIFKQIGKYRLESLLGLGGMGEVYRALDTQRDRHVALKLLPEALSGDQAYLSRFRRESNIAARLRDPHVIPIHDFGEINGQLFIDMRLVDGADIGTLLDRYGPIEPQRAVHLISQAAEALDAAHANDLVHRDIKPSNILVTSSDFVYVVDFGIARPIGGQQTRLTQTRAWGTLDYMAPERFKGHGIDGRADVYSLACVLHECLTGAPPFTGRDLPALIYAQLNFSPPAVSSLVEGVSPALDAVVARGMAKDPEERFPTAGALAAAAREALVAEAPTPQMTEVHHAWTEIPDPAWQQGATATAARPGVAEPPGAGPEAASYPATQGVPYSPTQTAAAFGVTQAGYTRPPENVPPGTSLDPGGSRLPPARRARGPAWRRLGVPILAAAAALTVAIVVVVMASPGTKPKTVPVSLTQTACGAPGLAPPTIGETIPVGENPNYVQVAPNGNFAYITNPGARAIDVLNTTTDQVSRTIPIPEGPPQAVSFSQDSLTAYVSVYGSHSVPLIAFIDTATGTVTSTVPVDNHEPGPSAVSLDGPYLYVPNHNMVQDGPGDNVLDVIDLGTKKLLPGIQVKANPHWVVVAKNGLFFYVTDHQSGLVTVLNAKTNKIITTINVGETPHSAALSPDGSRLAVTSYNGDVVYLINTATDQWIKTIPVGREPLDITYSPDGRYLFTANNLSNTVTVIDTANDCVIKQIPTGKAPTSISVLPDGSQAYVTDENDGTIEILNLPA